MFGGFKKSNSSSGSGGPDEALLASIQGASQSWASFQWVDKLEQAESNLSQSREAREQSVAARKELAETTKEFKRSVKTVEAAKQNLAADPSNGDNVSATVNSIDSMAKECRVIVKAYQGEIDNLTRRCKNAENAYSSMCSALTEMPDPASMLQTVVEQFQKQQKEMEQLRKNNEDLTKENKKLSHQAQAMSSGGLSKAEKEELIQLREDIVQYEIETKNLRNQDVTVRKLEAKIAELQENSQFEFQEQLEKAREELAETEGRKAEEALEREAAMERQVEQLQLQLKAERAGREAAQSHLLDADQGVGEREAAWEAQRRILVDDAERLRETLHQVTRERDELSLKMAATSSSASPRSGGGGFGRTPPPSGGVSMQDFMLERKAYEAEVSELSHTANSLREQLKQKDDAVLEARRSLQAKVDTLEQENSSLKSNILSLEAQLAGAPSQALLNSMKRELRILKRLEYNADDVDAAEDPEMTGAGLPESEEKNLESVLVEKLRRSESDLVKERNAKLEHAKECDRLKSEIEAALKAKEEADKLVASLETDLERAIAAPASSSSITKTPRAMPSLATHTEEEQASSLNSLLDPDAPQAPAAAKKSAPAPAKSASASEKVDDDHSVATIVMAQRDRLRARCEALEAERDSFKRELQAQVQSAESLKSDNTKLYEKVRYLQNFANSNNKGGFKKGGNDRDLDLEALEQRYEASVDPFRQFSRAERQRKLQEMPPMERVVFIVAKTVLGTKAMRTALFVYVTCLHLLVFITTTHWSHSGTCDHSDHEHLAHLPPHVAEHAKILKGG